MISFGNAAVGERCGGGNGDEGGEECFFHDYFPYDVEY